MTTFEIYVNDIRVCVAGLPQPGVITAGLTWVKGQAENDEEHIGVRIGGLISKSHTFLNWHDQVLEMGDEVRFKVCENKRVSKPKSRRRESVAQRSKSKLEALKTLANELGYDVVKR